MINLLSREQKQSLHHEYITRRRITAGGLCLAILIMSLVLSGLLFTQIQAKSKEVSLALEQVKNLGENEGNIKNELQEASRVVAIARTGATRESLYQLREMIAVVEPDTISIVNWQWETASGERAARIILEGRSDNRQSLLNFIQNLERLERVAEVKSPIANLIKDRDGEFNIEITLKPHDTPE